MAEIVMPQLGETVAEGTITGWHKQVGDAVQVGETLFEVSTDKVDTEIPAASAGVLTEILVAEGETVAVGTAVARVGEASTPTGQTQPAQAPAPSAAGRSSTGDAAGAPADGPTGGTGRRGLLSPVVRRLAKEHGVDLGVVAGTGQGGRITRDDVLAYVARRDQEAAQPVAPAAAGSVAPPGADGERRGLLSPVVRRLAREHGVDLGVVAGTGQGGRITRDDVLAYVAQRDQQAAQPVAPSPAPAAPAQAPAAPAATRTAAGRVESMSPIRVRIAERMVTSKQTAPHVFSVVEVDMEGVARARARHKDAFRQRHGFGLTFLPFVVCSAVQALGEYPAVNASVDLDARTVTYHDQVHLGVAVDLDGGGLIVPVIPDVGGLGVTELARRINDVATRARGKGLKPDEVSGSTFTVTNNGSFGSLLTAPVINQPNVAILSTELVEKRPVVIDDAIAIRHRMYLDMSWDHRGLDGSTAARFLGRVKQLLETTDWDARLAG